MDQITGVVLAGGLGRRMGGVDKGLQLFRGEPMVAAVLKRFAPQVDEVLINANQNIEQYEQFGHRIIPDRITGFAGPLAGLHRGLSEANYELAATVPCDSPFLPDDLVPRLYSEIEGNDLAVAKTFSQVHPVFCLCRRKVLPHLTAFLESGGRKIDAWYATLKVVEVNFDDQSEAFRNINTAEELSRLQRS
jgi:molybdopterin-guanine dinucleotide biosynthesis protein A